MKNLDTNKYTRRMLRRVIAAVVVLAPMLSTAAYATPYVIDQPITLAPGQDFVLDHENDVVINANITQRGKTGNISIYSWENIRVAPGVSITAGEVVWIAADGGLELGQVQRCAPATATGRYT